MKKANKTIRANSFAQGWVLQAGEQAGALRSRVPADKEGAIDAHIGKNLGELGQVREARTKTFDRAYCDGIRAAQDVRLYHGVGGDGQLGLN